MAQAMLEPEQLQLPEVIRLMGSQAPIQCRPFSSPEADRLRSSKTPTALSLEQLHCLHQTAPAQVGDLDYLRLEVSAALLLDFLIPSTLTSIK